jgi:hypothetical protein
MNSFSYLQLKRYDVIQEPPLPSLTRQLFTLHTLTPNASFYESNGIFRYFAPVSVFIDRNMQICRLQYGVMYIEAVVQTNRSWYEVQRYLKDYELCFIIYR